MQAIISAIPDPTVIRDGDTFYYCGSTGMHFPSLAIYTSKDLVNWSFLCHPFPKYDHLIHQILAQNEIPFIPNLPARVEITKRSGCGTSAYFVFNNDDKEKDFVLFGEPCHLNGFEMKIIKEAAPSSSKASSPL